LVANNDKGERMNDGLEWEFGSFAIIRNAKGYGSDKKEIDVPKCPKCDEYMLQLVRINAWRWICCNCPLDEAKE